MKKFYDDDVFLTSKTAEKIYSKIRNVPIFDYHCHLSPREIYEDKEFDNIGQMWLGGDHYKWRLMRTVGIDEKYITGDSSYKEKFINYAKAVELAVGNPLYHWTHMELKQFFGINVPLCQSNAEEIWDRANKVIKDKKLSPRKLIEMSNVSYIATTDDICDSLEYHKKIAGDTSFKTKVAPSFRTDNLFLYKSPDYPEYLKKLSGVSGVEVIDLASLKKALKIRVDFFASLDCKMTDVGIERFPLTVGSDEEADEIFKKVLSGEDVSTEDYDKFISNIYIFLASLYKENSMIMQLHLAVKRNASSFILDTIGKDAGGDCVGEAFPVSALTNLLDIMEKNGCLPSTLVYTLNPTMYDQIATGIRSFRDVSLGAAWWFCDHLEGINKQLTVFSETASLSVFYGMLTDSRSFLSYARHDYFRRILASFIGDKVEKGEYGLLENAIKTAAMISGENIKNKLCL